MNDTPTPRTDALRTKLHENINTPNIVKYMETVLHSNELETELTTAREEIAILKSKYADHHSEAERITSEIRAITAQRDLLIEVLEVTLNATVLNHRRDRWHSDAEYALNKIKLNLK